MSEINYINTQEIRRDLMGFLRQLAAGQEYVVLNRSKRVVMVSGRTPTISKAEARRNINQLLAAASAARKSAKHKNALDPNKSFKQLYAETIGEKYGFSRR